MSEIKKDQFKQIKAIVTYDQKWYNFFKVLLLKLYNLIHMDIIIF